MVIKHQCESGAASMSLNHNESLVVRSDVKA